MTRRRTKPRAGTRTAKAAQTTRHVISAAAQRKLAKVRTFCAALDEVSEKPSHGAPTFFVNGRVFAYFLDNHHGDGRLALWCASPPGAQAMLVDSDRDVYFVPPYVGCRGWVGVRLDRDAPWPQITSVLETAYDSLNAKKPARKR